ncbi:unnamed protein product [Cuscuta epithymum]|uniref:Uncharacterized protein n=1 Tax=Cuscuta epithymum TaxID=186058 RepID=A0AAV0C8A9_9ASTE|nr:unnamed protein product [Cuscuta epithymum]
MALSDTQLKDTRTALIHSPGSEKMIYVHNSVKGISLKSSLTCFKSIYTQHSPSQYEDLWSESDYRVLILVGFSKKSNEVRECGKSMTSSFSPAICSKLFVGFCQVIAEARRELERLEMRVEFNRVAPFDSRKNCCIQ